MKVAIIGGGISGISAAFWLEYFSKEQGSEIEIVLIEKNNKIGGTIDTFKKDGFTIESGPNGFLDSKPSTVNLFETAGFKDNLLPSNDKAKKRFIMRNETLHKLPETPGEFFKSGLISFSGKLRLIGELFIKAKKDDYDETVYEFAVRRLGREAADYLISPMVSGIFAGDARKLSLKACFPVIYNLEKEYGGLFKALMKKRKKSSGPAGPGGRLTSYKGGLINGLNDIVSSLQFTKIVLENGVKSIKKFKNIFEIKTENGDIFDANSVVIASPGYSAASFTEELDEDLSRCLSKIAYAPAFVVGFGFKDEDVESDLDGFGYLIPPNENKKILGALYTSSIFPERAPDKHKLVRVIMGGDLNRWIVNKSRSELEEIAFDEIKNVLGIKGKAPVMIKSFYWEHAIPQYYQGHLELVNEIEKICKRIGNIYIGGNLLYGVGLNDCTQRSYDIASEIL